MLDFIIKLLGLDSQAKGFLVGYRSYIALAVLACVHAGPVLIALGNAMLLVSAAIALLGQYADGSLALLACIAAIKAKISEIAPVMAAAGPDISWFTAAAAAAYWKASHDRKHVELIAAMKAPTLPPTSVPNPSPFSTTDNFPVKPSA